MHASLRSSLHLALAGTSLLTLATVAAAQDPAATAGNATVLEDIVVDGGSGGVITADGYVGKSSATGAKIDTPFIQTPQSISSVTKEQLEDRNPQTLLDRGEQVALPPLLLIQGTNDTNISVAIIERFLNSYRAAGGDATLELFEGEPHGFGNQDTDAARRAIASIQGFIARQLG